MALNEETIHFLVTGESAVEGAYNRIGDSAKRVGTETKAGADKAKGGLNEVEGAAKKLPGAFDAAGAAAKRDLGTVKTESEAAHGALRALVATAAAGVATAGINSLTSHLIQVSTEASNAGTKLEAMLNVRGQSASLDALQKSIGSISEKTGLDDDALANTAAHLLSFGLSAKQIAQILPGIVSQAQTMDQPLDSVADSFGRAFGSGSVGALTKTGVVLSDADKQAIKLAQSTSQAAGQQELFNRVLASYQSYAVKLGQGIDESTRAINYFGVVSGNVQESVGDGARDMRASWMGALTPMLVSLNENHKGALHFAGGLLEIGTEAANVATPIFGFVQGLAQIKTAMVLSALAKDGDTLATTANTTAAGINAAALELEGDAALAASGRFGILGRAKALAGGGLGTAAKVAGAVGAGVIIGSDIYNAIKPEGNPDAGQIESYYWNRLRGQSAIEAASTAQGIDPYAKGNRAEAQSKAIFDKSRATPRIVSNVPPVAALASLGAASVPALSVPGLNSRGAPLAGAASFQNFDMAALVVRALQGGAQIGGGLSSPGSRGEEAAKGAARPQNTEITLRMRNNGTKQQSDGSYIIQLDADPIIIPHQGLGSMRGMF